MNQRIIPKILASFLIAYTLCYGLIRFRTNMIIHSSSISGCNYSSHSVVPGDSGLIGYAINSGLALVFTPLRLLELSYWYLVQPVDSPISEEDRKLNKFASCTNKS